LENSKLIFFLIFISVFFVACNKENDVPCINFPCNGTDDKLINYNRVAYDPEFRIGTWANVRASTSSPDTIIFHNDSTWSRFNENGGVYNKRYAFDGLYLIVYTNNIGEEVNSPLRRQTYYNDSTGVFAILNQYYADGYQHWGHYIKIE
jgi:hypothetical protein